MQIIILQTLARAGDEDSELLDETIGPDDREICSAMTTHLCS